MQNFLWLHMAFEEAIKWKVDWIASYTSDTCIKYIMNHYVRTNEYRISFLQDQFLNHYLLTIVICHRSIESFPFFWKNRQNIMNKCRFKNKISCQLMYYIVIQTKYTCTHSSCTDFNVMVLSITFRSTIRRFGIATRSTFMTNAITTTTRPGAPWSPFSRRS